MKLVINKAVVTSDSSLLNKKLARKGDAIVKLRAVTPLVHDKKVLPTFDSIWADNFDELLQIFLVVSVVKFVDPPMKIWILGRSRDKQAEKSKDLKKHDVLGYG